MMKIAPRRCHRLVKKGDRTIGTISESYIRWFLRCCSFVWELWISFDFFFFFALPCWGFLFLLLLFFFLSDERDLLTMEQIIDLSCQLGFWRGLVQPHCCTPC